MAFVTATPANPEVDFDITMPVTNAFVTQDTSTNSQPRTGTSDETSLEPVGTRDEAHERIRMFGISSLFCIGVLLKLTTLLRIQRKAIPTKSRLLYYAASTILITYSLSQGRVSLLSIK